LIRYIKTVSPILKTLETNEVFKKGSFFNYLDKLIKTPTLSFNLRKQAVFELLLSSAENFEQHLNFKNDLNTHVLKTIVNETRQWAKSQDLRKRKFADQLSMKWSKAIENGDVKRLEALIESQFFDVNYKNISHVSVLQLASYYKQQAIIDWLIKNPEFDFNAKNSVGYNEVEQLRLSGKSEIADMIEHQRPEVQSQKFMLQERNTEIKTTDYPNGTPIIDFVRFEPGSFMMGEGERKVLTTISKPFELMSVDITQKTYSVVVELLWQNFPDRDVLNAVPSDFKGENRPVERVSYDDISLWKKGLNELSKLDNVKVQDTLKELFPGHKQGDQYSRPTEAQWEYVSRLGGVAESNFSHGKGEAELSEYAVYSQNSGLKTQAVGLKKPVFYNGKPIYDLHGNIWKWLEDWYGSNLSGGIDPQGAPAGSNRVIRGGSWDYVAWYLCLGYRHKVGPGLRYRDLGFRLVRNSL
jgi:formylglycine-generating enzyme required for sulfatase activity